MSFNVRKSDGLNTQFAPRFVPGIGIQYDTGHLVAAKCQFSYSIFDRGVFGPLGSFVTSGQLYSGRESAATLIEVCESDEVRGQLIGEEQRPVIAYV